MDTFSIAGAVFRRWWIVVPILAATAVGAYVLGARIPPEYTASGSALIVQAEDDPEPDRISAQVLAEIIQDSDVAVPLNLEVGIGNYTADSSGDDLVRIASRSSERSVAVELTRTLLNRLGPTLAAREEAEGIPPEGRRQVEVLHRPSLGVQLSNDPPQWEATGSARLVDATVPEAGDGIEDIGGGAARALLRRQLRDADVVTGFGANPMTDYAVEEADPAMTVQASGDDEQAVLTTVSSVLAVAPDVLTALQEESGVDPRLGVRQFSEAEIVDVDATTSVRAIVALAGVGIALALMAAVAVDAIIAAFRRRRRERSTPTDGRHERLPAGSSPVRTTTEAGNLGTTRVSGRDKTASPT